MFCFFLGGELLFVFPFVRLLLFFILLFKTFKMLFESFVLFLVGRRVLLSVEQKDKMFYMFSAGLLYRLSIIVVFCCVLLVVL